MKDAPFHSRSLLLLAIAGLFGGCLDDMSVSRYQSIPTAMPLGVSFVDTDTSAGLRGSVVIQPAIEDSSNPDKWTFDTYSVRWGDANGAPLQYPTTPWELQKSNFIGHAYRYTPMPTLELDADIPAGAASIVVRTSNALGDATNGVWIPIENLVVDPGVPKNHPRNVTFGDSYRNLRVGGGVYFYPPSQGEGDITHYVARFAASSGCPLRGPILGSVAADNLPHQKVLYFSSAVLPPNEASFIAVIPANAKGEAYLANCNYSRAAVTNFIDPSDTPYYAAKSVFFTDDDETRNVSGALTINPAQSEVDLSTGYYVTHMIRDDQGRGFIVGEPTFFAKNGGVHIYQVSKLTPGFDELYISTGISSTNTNSPYVHKVDFKKPGDNLVGDWITIENHKSGNCLAATAANAEVVGRTCDEYDTNQRWRVSAISSPWNDNDDDFHNITSVAFPDQHIYRRYWLPGTATVDGYGLLRLRPAGEDNWESAIQLKAYTKSEIQATNADWKKMAFVNKVALTYHYACATQFFADSDKTTDDEVRSEWSNCAPIPAGGFAVKVSNTEWKFTHADGSVKRFNDQ